MYILCKKILYMRNVIVYIVSFCNKKIYVCKCKRTVPCIAVCIPVNDYDWKMLLKVHKNENFFGFDFEFCTISLLVMHK